GVVGLNAVPQGCQRWRHASSRQLISLLSVQHLQPDQPLLQLALAEGLDGGGGLSWVPGDPHETAATRCPADLEDWDALGAVGQLARIEDAGVQEGRGAPGPHTAPELEVVLRRGEVSEGEHHLPPVQLLLREAPCRLLVDLHLAKPWVPGDPVQGVACPQLCGSQEVIMGHQGPVQVLGHLQQ
ncbi:hypothetical protein N327_06165, partial [Fulmarus glacialis]